MNTEKELQFVFSRALSVPEHCITEDLTYQSIPEWDSMGHLFLIEEMETTFNIHIEQSDILSLASYTDAKNLLIKYKVDLRN